MANPHDLIDSLSDEELDILNSDPEMLAAFKAKHVNNASAPVADAAPAPEEPKKSFLDRTLNVVDALRRGGLKEDGTENTEARKDLIDASSLPVRGFKGVGVAAEHLITDAIDNKAVPNKEALANALNRGTEATKVGYEPQPGEKLGNFAGEMADPRLIPLNAGLGKVAEVAIPAVGGFARFLGKQAARGVEGMTGVPAAAVETLAETPGKVIFAPSSKVTGEAFQAAKTAGGVTPLEERAIAKAKDVGKETAMNISDTLRAKLESGAPLTTGETLEAKAAAGQATKKASGSNKQFYGKDFASFAEKLAKEAPEIAEAQGKVALSKTKEAFMHLLPYNKSGSPAVLRMLAGAGAGAVNPLAAAAVSPLAAGAGTLATALTAKAAGAVGKAAAKSPAARAALIAALNSKGK